MNRRSLIGSLTAALLVLSTHAAAATSAQTMVDRWAKSKALRGLTIGLSVVDSVSGRVFAELNANTVLNPASGTKLLTTAAALHTLPREPSWTTSAHGVIQGAALAGPLRLVGKGDPKLLIAHLEKMADDLSAQGLTRIDEGLILHTGHFDDEHLPPAYEQKKTDAGYRPAVGALAANFGAVRINVKPGKRIGKPVRVSVEGGKHAVSLVVSATTGKGKIKKLTIKASEHQDGRTEFRVSGTLGIKASAVAVRKRIHDPDLWTGHVFASLLRARGIMLGTPLRMTQDALPEDAGPALSTIRPRSLPETLADINIWSNNFMAEMVLKQMGCTNASACSWKHGVKRVTEVLQRLGLPEGSFNFINGSGLYKATRISAKAMTTLLVAMKTDPARAGAFEGGLAVSGKSGTLRSRMVNKALRNRVKAKTGTLDEVVSLSGYLSPRAGRGHTLAFAIFVNGATPKRTARIRRKIDTLLRRLTRASLQR